MSRDFCFVNNAVQANLLAAVNPNDEARNQVYNVAVGDRTSLNQLFELIRAGLEKDYPHLKGFKPLYQQFRAGDIKHSWADISKAKNLLKYSPSHSISAGIEQTLAWYTKNSIS